MYVNGKFNKLQIDCDNENENEILMSFQPYGFLSSMPPIFIPRSN